MFHKHLHGRNENNKATLNLVEKTVKKDKRNNCQIYFDLTVKPIKYQLHILMLIFLLVFIANQSEAHINPTQSSDSIKRNQHIYDVENFGALGDGKKLNTRAIQKAIDICAQQGGGTVLLKKGRYLSGSILVRDNVTLHLQANAVLLGSKKVEDYSSLGTMQDGMGQNNNRYFIGAYNAKNICIEGKGEINGQGDSPEFRTSASGINFRPKLLNFYNCSQIKVSGITLRNSAKWVSHYFGCTDILIQNISIESWTNANNDGIDIDCCTDVRINNCKISSGDDAICLKSTANRPTKNIVISNCLLRTGHGAFKIGTETVGNIQNVTISNCVVDSAGGGVEILCMDGAAIRYINISDMTMQNVEMPIFIRLGSRLNTYHEGQEKKATGSIEHVKIQNIQAKTFSPGRTDNHHLKYQSGIFITGIAEHAIKNLSLENISIELHGGAGKEDTEIIVPENIAKYPEFNFFSEWLPSYGAYIRHAENVRLQNLRYKTILPDKRYVIVAEDVKNITLNKIETEIQEDGASFYCLKEVERCFVSGHFLRGPGKSFLTIDGNLNEHIYFFNNALEKIENRILFKNGANEDAIEYL